MAKKKYQIVKQLPDNLGGVLVMGSVLGPGDPLPDNTPKKTLDDCKLRGFIESVSGKKASPKKSPTVNRGQFRPVSKWDINPVDLVGKDLTDLNIMILEKDPDFDPFTDMDAAVAFLSKDFEV
jgi:hypothetical protein